MTQAPDESGAGEDEFAIIARHFAPLANTPAARGLIDDVAFLERAGDLIVTTDAIVEGVHFLPDDPLDLVARKALRANISDIVAKGAAPTYYLLSLIWPDHRAGAEIEAFARGLAFDQRVYGVTLIGGDTARTPGPLTVSITLFGVPFAIPPTRSGARPGDDVWVTGAIGDGGLGLEARAGGLGELSDAQRAFVIGRYQTPEPRLAFAPIVAAFAHASCDVSDGLLADAAHIGQASGALVEIDLASVPLSEAGRAWAGANEARWARLASAGDDFEVLFTAAPDARAEIARRAGEAGVPATRIGRVVGAPAAGETGARLIGASGPIALERAGFAHRLGAGAR